MNADALAACESRARTSGVLSRLPTASRWRPANRLLDMLQGRDVVLYGAGRGFFTFQRFCLQKMGVEARLVVDRRFDGHGRFAGRPSCGPQALLAEAPWAREAAVFITIGDAAVRAEIADRLEANGFRFVFSAYDVYEYHTHYTPAGLLQDIGGHIRSHAEEIERAFALFAHDAASQRIFAAVLGTYADGVADVPASPYREQYFPSDLPMACDLSRYISCGAFTGDTVEQARRHVGRMQAVACFEPDPGNFAALTAYLSQHSDQIADMLFSFPCGLHRSNQRLRFSSAHSTNSSIDPAGDAVVHCVALDQVLFNFRPTYLTMDIEGAELDALAGARETLRRHRPELALSAYHCVDHLWRLPLFVDRLGVGYRLYLRNYSGMVSETVLYASTQRSDRP
ncbi:MAG: FkbM family methyltransferase [Rhodocyclaceae bacterium]|nr:FkbM family methyltransferase [Rhodocyclaceae bacterium]MCB1963785.1 FkbM family methyltransferase [Rhodocyclaceae bacterium]